MLDGPAFLFLFTLTLIVAIAGRCVCPITVIVVATIYPIHNLPEVVLAIPSYQAAFEDKKEEFYFSKN